MHEKYKSTIFQLKKKKSFSLLSRKYPYFFIWLFRPLVIWPQTVFQAPQFTLPLHSPDFKSSHSETLTHTQMNTHMNTSVIILGSLHGLIVSLHRALFYFLSLPKELKQWKPHKSRNSKIHFNISIKKKSCFRVVNYIGNALNVKWKWKDTNKIN